MIVSKFGGTSVADADAIRRLAAIVELRAEQRPLVVVSALAGVTDGLLALASSACISTRNELTAAVEALVRHHETVAMELPNADDAMATLYADAEALLASLTAAAGRRLRPAELDHLVGHGELWSSRLVAAAMAGSGLRAAWV